MCNRAFLNPGLIWSVVGVFISRNAFWVMHMSTYSWIFLMLWRWHVFSLTWCVKDRSCFPLITDFLLLQTFFYNNNKPSSTFKIFLLRDFLTISNGLEVETLSRRRCSFPLILISIIVTIIAHVIFLFRWNRCQCFWFFVLFLWFIVLIDSLTLRWIGM